MRYSVCSRRSKRRGVHMTCDHEWEVIHAEALLSIMKCKKCGYGGVVSY